MLSIVVPDIGDGLSGSIYTQTGEKVQLDCGSQQSARIAYGRGMLRDKYRTNFFILSHFHSDHYNGLFEGVRAGHHFPLEEVIMPVIPEFTRRKEVFQCLFAMNMRVLGNDSGSMDYDFLSVINRLSNNPTYYRRVKQGDEVVLGGTHFQVLWPPSRLTDDDILPSVEKALEKFSQALQQDKILGRIYRALDDEGDLENYLSQENIFGSENIINSEIPSLPEEPRDIPDITKEANKALRKVANRLSLAFRIDSQLLFLGDLESREIDKVIGYLEREERLYFSAMLTPHHGTHWGDNMPTLSCDVAVSSVGKKLFKYVKPNYKYIVRRHLITHLQGDVVHPIFPKLDFELLSCLLI